ncbi:MAG TPA: hypothetical protein PLB45_00460, partial [Bacilli bacterium]|nr:hypothetical protein [Bacilli bacterium]
MINITKENIEIEDSLNNRIKSITKFLGVKSKLINGKLISIDKTNLAYIEPHKLEINNTTYLFFNDSNLVYINTLENAIDI